MPTPRPLPRHRSPRVPRMAVVCATAALTVAASLLASCSATDGTITPAAPPTTPPTSAPADPGAPGPAAEALATMDPACTPWARPFADAIDAVNRPAPTATTDLTAAAAAAPPELADPLRTVATQLDLYLRATATFDQAAGRAPSPAQLEDLNRAAAALNIDALNAATTTIQDYIAANCAP